MPTAIPTTGWFGVVLFSALASTGVGTPPTTAPLHTALRQAATAPQLGSNTALHQAVERDDAAAVARLIRTGADVTALNRYGAAPISLACARGNADIIEQLIKAASSRRCRRARRASCRPPARATFAQ